MQTYDIELATNNCRCGKKQWQSSLMPTTKLCAYCGVVKWLDDVTGISNIINMSQDYKKILLIKEYENSDDKTRQEIISIMLGRNE